MKRPVAFVLLAFVTACAHGAPPPAALPAPTAKDLPRPDAIPGIFTVRQKLTARSARGGGAFEAVLQKKPGEVLLVGLTPYGSRAFVLRQTDADVQFTSYIPRELPFPPTFILLDVHRVLDAWLGPGLASGARSGTVGVERVDERWRDGKLVERRFTRLAAAEGAPRGDVTITYSGDGPAGLASLVTLENRRFGYTLTVESFPAH
ncbi:MAG TPA: DUF3261 domain-containing protein [Polyangia bacterium]|jgi:hypothetical protein|nr:DUF3261 domain-containing protein [Polyangia bacterium]